MSTTSAHHRRPSKIREHNVLLIRSLIDKQQPQLFVTLSPNRNVPQLRFETMITATHARLNRAVCNGLWQHKRHLAKVGQVNGKSIITAISCIETGERTVRNRHAHWLVWSQDRYVDRIKNVLPAIFEQIVGNGVDVLVDDYEPGRRTAAYLAKEVWADNDNLTLLS